MTSTVSAGRRRGTPRTDRRPSPPTHLLLAALACLATLACGGPRATSYDDMPLPPDQAGEVNDEPEVEPPPPSLEQVRFERRPGYVYVEGRWVWTARGWMWQPGRYLPVRRGYVYRQGRWEHRGGHWRWSDGRWIEERPGHVWVRGHWRDSGDARVWVPGRWETARAGYVWEPGQWVRSERGNWVWSPGRWRKL